LGKAQSPIQVMVPRLLGLPPVPRRGAGYESRRGVDDALLSAVVDDIAAHDRAALFEHQQRRPQVVLRQSGLAGEHSVARIGIAALGVEQLREGPRDTKAARLLGERRTDGATPQLEQAVALRRRSPGQNAGRVELIVVWRFALGRGMRHGVKLLPSPSQGW